MKLILTFLLLINLSDYLCAQDYIFSNTDTIIGKISLPAINAGNIDYLHIRNENLKRKYNALEISGFTLGNKSFQTKKIGNRYVFLECIKCGDYLEWLKYREESEQDFSHQILIKPDGTYIEIPLINFEQKLNAFLNECELSKEKHDIKLKRKNLDVIIDYFNNCMKSRKEIPEKNRDLSKFIEVVRGKNELQQNLKEQLIDNLNVIEEKLPNPPPYLIKSLKDLTDKANLQNEFKSFFDKYLK